ncbi:MAG TPA: urate hydroxylase PuuD, partial [Kofleriaceae bacterium]|nr:urate hydroxylase PuuD [Kofleriaceae bacterium]
MQLNELLDVVFRWAHLIAGIMWIGNSMLFNWRDRTLIPPPAGDEHRLSQGKIYMVHSGAFYEVEKKLLEPNGLPAQLHWFKWQNAITWMTGIALLVLVYFLHAEGMLVDTSVRKLEPWQAIAISVGSLIVGFAIYDLVWRTLGDQKHLAHALSLVLLLAASYGYTEVFY